MKLGYKFYRNSLIKVAILSVAGLCIFWDYFTGKGHPDTEPGALILIAVIMVVGNVGLFIAMRRARRRESAEIATNRVSEQKGPQHPVGEIPPLHHSKDMDSADQRPKQKVMDRQVSERGLGIFALIGCAVLSYLSIVSPLLAASRHETSVSFSMKGAVVAPVLLAIGLINVFMGERANQILGRRQKPSALGWLIYVVTFGIGILLYQWLKSRLREYGYQV